MKGYEFHGFSGIMKDCSYKQLAQPEISFFNVSDSVLGFVALPPFFGRKNIPRNVSQLQKKGPKDFEANTHFTEKTLDSLDQGKRRLFRCHCFIGKHHS